MRHILHIVTITLVAFILLPSCNEIGEGGKTILYAHRDAPIGGLWLDLKDDNNFKCGYKRGEEYKGTYQMKGDTILLTFHEPSPIQGAIDSRLLIKGHDLRYLDTQGGLEILVNEIK